MERFLWICFAGALGTGARYLVGLWAERTFGTAFPYGTLMVNVAGCFLIAVILQMSLSTQLVSPTLRLALSAGFLGGLTTYSSFNYEATRLLEDRASGTGLLYIALTAAACFVAGLVGLIATRRLLDV